MVNLDKIFDLFDPQTKEDTFIDFTNDPIYWVGMYIKLIKNFPFYIENLKKYIVLNTKEINIDDIEKAGKWLNYNEALNYLNKININDENHKKAIKKWGEEFKKTLQIGIDFFIEFEEYEKCVILSKIIKEC